MDSEQETKVPPLNLEEDFPAPSIEQWREIVENDLKGATIEKKLVWKSPDGPGIKPLYSKEDTETVNHHFPPGFAPYVRGSWPLSGVKPAWQIRQDCFFPDPDAANDSIRQSLERGQTAVCFRLDEAARDGIDPANQDNSTFVGRDGVVIDSLDDLSKALHEIDLTKYPVTLESGASAPSVLAGYLAYIEDNKIDTDMICGGLGFDPIQELLTLGETDITLRFKEMSDLLRACHQSVPGVKPITVHSETFSDAGASTVQELGFSIASAVEYVRALKKENLSSHSIFQSICFDFTVSTNLFMEIAKLRAARVLWAKVAKAFEVDDEVADRMQLHASTSRFTKTKDDIYNNLIRNCVESFAGAVGGCDSMNIEPFDVLRNLPDQFSSHIARNQQIILQEESHLNRVVDPGGGSYYIENLTDAIGREAWAVFQEVESKGGMIECIKSGYIQEKVEETRNNKQKLVKQRRTPIVGVSQYVPEFEVSKKAESFDQHEFVEARRKAYQASKSKRDQAAVNASLEKVSNAVSNQEASIIDCANEAIKSGACFHEVSAAIRKGSDGEVIKVGTLAVTRASVPFEDLRHRTKKVAKATGKTPKAVLILFGNLAMRRARADFCINFFRAGGFDVVELSSYQDLSEQAAQDALAESSLVVACSDDESYPVMIPAFAGLLKSLNENTKLVVAGNPASAEELKQNGVDDFVHIKTNIIDSLNDFLNFFENQAEVTT